MSMIIGSTAAMKNIILFFTLIFCLAAYSAEDEPRKGPEGKSRVNSVKSIRRDPQDEKQTTGTKRPKKSVEFDLKSPSLPVPALPDSQIVNPNIVLKRMSGSREYIRVIRIIYADAEHAGIQKIAGMSRDEALNSVERMKQTREYAQPIDFGNYMICDTTTPPKVIGRLMFTNLTFEGVPNEGLLQTHFHLVSEARGKGLGVEVLKCLIKEVINSKLAKKCSFMRTMLMHEPQKEEEEEGASFESTLRGIYGKSNLLRAQTLDNNTTIAAYYQAGFGVKIYNGDVIMSYPPECYPHGPSLDRSEVGTVLVVSKLMQDCRILKGKNQNLFPLKSNAPPSEEAVIDIGEICRNSKLYGKQIESLQKNYKKLLAVTEPFTFLSALNILNTIFGMTKEDLDAEVSSEKALSILSCFEKQANIPNGLEFLKSFAPLPAAPPQGSAPKPPSLHLYLEEDSI
jgi:hypothetical protein